MAIFVLILISGVLGYLYFNAVKKAGLLNDKIKSISHELQKYQPIKDIQSEVSRLIEERVKSQIALDEVKSKLAMYEFELDAQELGFYQPKFHFDDVVQYAEALGLVREAQKELIKQKQVFDESGSSNANKKFKDIARLAVSAFNGEASSIVDSVRYDNFEKSKGQLQITFEKINSLISDTGLKVSQKYFELKVKELALVYDFKEAEQKAKEEQAELKAAMKEEEQARVEAEKAREKAIEEQERYEAALEQARKEMASKSDEEKANYEAKILDIQNRLTEATAERERATSMAQITKRGHVYIISNIGSFGENVLKIGMTRRKDPAERIKELGDASVPFGFDIHAMIETEDAPALENTLHTHFEQRRKNRVNLRKEFFNVNVDEIAQACEKIGLKVKLSKVAEAREYKETLKLNDEKNAA